MAGIANNNVGGKDDGGSGGINESNTDNPSLNGKKRMKM